VVRTVVDPDVLQVVVDRVAELALHTLGMREDLLQQVPDLESVTVVLLIGDHVAGYRRPIEVIDELLLGGRQPLEPRSIDAEHEKVLAVSAQALELPHHTASLRSLGSLRHWPLLRSPSRGASHNRYGGGKQPKARAHPHRPSARQQYNKSGPGSQ